MASNNHSKEIREGKARRDYKMPALAVFMVAALCLMPIGITQTLPPSPEDTVDDAEDEVDEALEEVYGDEFVGSLLPTPDSLRAKSVMDTVDSQMNAVKANFLLGNMEFRDFDDVEMDELTIREGRLPESAFFHSDLLEDLPETPDPPSPPGGGGGGGNDCGTDGGGSEGGDTRSGGESESTNTESTNGDSSASFEANCGSHTGSPSSTQEIEDLVPDGDDEESNLREKRNALMEIGDEWTDYHDIGVISREDLSADPGSQQSSEGNVTGPYYEPPPWPEPPTADEEGSGDLTSQSTGTILFQDDFSSNTLDTQKWTVLNSGYNVEVANQQLEMTVREQMETVAKVRSSTISHSFSSTGGVSASLEMARNIAGSGYVADLQIRLVNADNPSNWIELRVRPYIEEVQLRDSTGFITILSADAKYSGFRDFDLHATGSDYSGGFDTTGYSRSSSLFSGASGVYLMFRDSTGGSSSGYKETSARDNVVVTTYGSTNSAPNAPSKPSGPTSGDVGSTYWYSTSGTDADGDSVRYQFDWGDGTRSWTGWVSSGQTASASHSWSSEGSYNVFARAEDSTGQYSSWSSSLGVTISGVNDPPNTPSQPSGPGSGLTGTTYSYSTSASDPEGDSVKYQFDWGDGTRTWTNWVSSGQTASASHSWSSSGSYSVFARARDSNGAYSSWSPAKTVSISDPVSCSGSKDNSPEVVYHTTFGNEASDWDLSGLWHASSLRSYSGTCSLWYGQSSTGDYNTGSANSGSATSPVINLPAGSNSVLTYRSWYETEAEQAWDLKWVEILSSSGQSLHSFSHVDGPMGEWTFESHSLSQWAGQSIRVQFNFDTRDAVYNDYEGWYVDDVKIRVTDSNMPDHDEPSVNVFTTENYRSSGSGAAWHVYRNDDGSVEDSAVNRLSGDVAEKTFRVNMDSHDGAGSAWLYIHASSTGCSSDSEWTHRLDVNNVWRYNINPCWWGSGARWGPIEIPVQWLDDGANTITIVPLQSSSVGLKVSIDGGSPGVDSHIVENGDTRDGELIWRLYVQKGDDFEYDMLYRFWAVQYIDENNDEHWEYAYEGFVHFDYPDLDSLHFIVYDDRDGERWRQWQTVTWQQNNYWNNRDSETWWWPHRAYDPDQMNNGDQGEVPKQKGTYYTWYRVEGEVRTPSGDSHTWREIVLVDNQLSWSKQTQKQNPPAQPVADKYDMKLNVKAEAYWEVYDVPDYGHQPWPENGEGTSPIPGKAQGDGRRHAHDRMGVEAHLIEYSERIEKFWDAYAVADKIVSSYVDWLESGGLDDWLLKKIKISKIGGATSDVLTAAQTGRLAYLNAYDKDGWFTVPTTDIGIHPKGILASFGPKGVAAAGAATAIDAIPQMGHKVTTPPGCGSPPTVGCGPSEQWTWNKYDIFW